MAFQFTPSAAVKGPASLAASTSLATGSAVPFVPGQAPTVPAAPPVDVNALPTPGKASFANVLANLKQVPGQLAQLGKNIFSGPIAAGQDITGAIIGAPIVDTTANDALDKQLMQKLSSLRATGQGQSDQAKKIMQVLSTPNQAPTAEQQNPILTKSNESIAGDFVSTAADILSAGSLESGAKAIVKPEVTGFLQGALKGAKAGAINGGFTGAIQSFASALQGNKKLGDVVTSTLGGGAAGAAGGAVIGGALGGIVAPPKAAATPEEKLQQTLQMTAPTLNKADSISAMERAGQGGGADTGALGTTIRNPTARDIAVAKSVQDVVQPGKPIDSIIGVNGKIENVAENQVRPVLQANPAAFNIKTLNAYIRDNTIIPNYIKADPVLEKTYELTRDSMLHEASQNPKVMEGLFDSRISFDHVADNQVGSLDPTDVKVSVIKQAVLDTRRSVNDFIAENVQKSIDAKVAAGTMPAGSAQNFTSSMKLMNQMYEARSNIAESNYKLLKGADVANSVLRWVAQNPKKVKALTYGAGLAGLGIIAPTLTHLEAAL